MIDYNAHVALRHASQIEPRLASVRALHAIRAERRARSERWAAIAFALIGAAALFAIFAAATAA